MALKTGADKPMSAEAYERRVLEEVASGLHIRVKAIEAAGVAALAPEDLAKRMLSLVPTPIRNPMADLVGPFYDTTRVQTLLDVSKQAVSDRRKHGSVLAMRTGDGLWVYPVFQFEARRIRPELVGVLRVFRGHDGWTAGVWLTTRNDELEGRSPLEWLVHGLDQDLVLRLAARATQQSVLAALRFIPGHDRGLALFGDSGVPDPPWPVATPPTPGATPPTPVADVAEALGIPVVDVPDRDQLTFSEPSQPADA